MGKIKEISRAKSSRRAKHVFIIVCEGRNETECNYLSNFKTREGQIIIKPIPCEATDPKSMIAKAKYYYEKDGLSCDEGDRVFCLIDVDNSAERAELIEKLKNENPNIIIICSNPCFEVWYLFHLQEHPKYLKDGSAAKAELRTFIPNYRENYDIYVREPLIRNNTETAINNCKNKKALYSKDGNLKMTLNPYTDMDILMIELLKNLNKT